MTIRVAKRDGVVEVCGPAADVLAVVGLVWGFALRVTVVKDDKSATANWGLQ